MTYNEIFNYCRTQFNPGQYFVNDDLSVDIDYLDTRRHDIQNFPFKIGKVRSITTDMDLGLLPIDIFHLKSVICPDKIKETSTYKKWKLYRTLLGFGNNFVYLDDDRITEDETDYGQHNTYYDTLEEAINDQMLEDIDLSEIK
jgi:hypothetical protein